MKKFNSFDCKLMASHGKLKIVARKMSLTLITPALRQEKRLILIKR